MSNRKMISKRIVRSAQFLKMPSESQTLYFQLQLDADDDGVVDTYAVMQILGSAPDNLKLLIAKGFIVQLNENEVCFIKDWREHNEIRADRLVPSIYRELLKKKIPGIQLVAPKARSDVKDNTRRLEGAQVSEQVSTQVALPEAKKKYTEEDMAMAELLSSLIQKNTPEWENKSSLESWAEDINKLFRIDGRSYKQIEYMIRWVQGDTFWSTNILSARKLREKFNDLIPKVKASVSKKKTSIGDAIIT